jgi:hypothetical protein
MTVAAVLALTMTLASGRPAHALEALRPSLKELSQKLADYLKGRDEKAIAVGAFTGPARTLSSSGPGIKQILIEELKKKDVEVSKDARLEVKGDYQDVEDKDSQLLALRLRAVVRDRQGDEVVMLDTKVEDPDVLAQVLGITRPDFGAGLTPEKESEKLKRQLDHPDTKLLRKTRIQAAPESHYAIEVLVWPGNKEDKGKKDEGYRPLKPSMEEGQAFVDLKSGQVFAIRLINDSDFDAAVELRLDGLSAFAFSEHKDYRHFIVGKKDTALIKGWHRTNKVSDEFLITGYAKSAVAELLANPDGIGTITASFAAAWDPKGKPPEDEGSQFRDPFNPAVGRGNPVQAPYQEVVRESGRVRDVISVRYKKPSP